MKTYFSGAPITGISRKTFFSSVELGALMQREQVLQMELMWNDDQRAHQTQTTCLIVTNGLACDSNEVDRSVNFVRSVCGCLDGRLNIFQVFFPMIKIGRSTTKTRTNACYREKDTVDWIEYPRNKKKNANFFEWKKKLIRAHVIPFWHFNGWIQSHVWRWCSVQMGHCPHPNLMLIAAHQPVLHSRNISLSKHWLSVHFDLAFEVFTQTFAR